MCALPENAKCKTYFTEDDDCIKQTWIGYCFMNPPYSKPEQPCKKNCKKKSCVERGYHLNKYKYGQIDFVKKAYESVFIDKTAECVVCLIPSRTDTETWHTYIWDTEYHKPKDGVQVRFLEGRLKFGDADNAAPFPSAIVVFMNDN